MQVSDFFKRKPVRRDGVQSAHDIIVSATRILEAANDKNLTAETLVEDSGYSSGTIFHRFSSKTHILRAVIAFTYERNINLVMAKLEGAGNLDVEKAIEIIVSHYQNLIYDNKRFMLKLLQTAVNDSILINLAVNHQYTICGALIDYIKLNCSDATKNPTNDIIPVFNGILFGSFRSANLSHMNGINSEQANYVKKSLKFVLTC